MKNLFLIQLAIAISLISNAAFGSAPECWNHDRRYVVINNGNINLCYRPKVKDFRDLNDFEVVQDGLCSVGRFKMARLDTGDIACANISRCGDPYGRPVDSSYCVKK